MPSGMRLRSSRASSYRETWKFVFTGTTVDCAGIVLLWESAASVAVDSTGNRLVLSGLRRVSRGTVVLIL